jgi:hypothetical protein
MSAKNHACFLQANHQVEELRLPGPLVDKARRGINLICHYLWLLFPRRPYIIYLLVGSLILGPKAGARVVAAEIYIPECRLASFTLKYSGPKLE